MHIHTEIPIAFDYGVLTSKQVFPLDIQAMCKLGWEWAIFFHNQYTLAEMLAIEMDTKKFAEEKEGNFTLWAGSNLPKSKPAIFLHLQRLNGVGPRDFTNTRAIAVHARRTEHDIAMQYFSRY